MIINKFVPPFFTERDLTISELNEFYKRELIYASRERYALFHVMKSLGSEGTVMAPAYICSSILEPIKKLGMQPAFYDIEIEDLNASLESIDTLYKRTKARTLLVASMYGNPGNLVEIEKYCKQHEILLIDDAAQSLGSELEGRKVGFFGDGGFFSFSPGKPTAGHLGAFFWTKNGNYIIDRTNHLLCHKVAYYNYYFNRLNSYKYSRYKIFEVLRIVQRIFFAINIMEDDDICEFEKRIIGGILGDLVDGKYDFRKNNHNKFLIKYKDNDLFSIIHAKRGIPINHKYVIRAESPDRKLRIIKTLRKYGIYSQSGYQALSDSEKFLPNTSTIKDCIIEIPIEEDDEKTEYFFRVIDNILLGEKR